MPVHSIAIARCHCGNLRAYAVCCGRFHQGEAPETAQQLLRARYSAYVLLLEDYLLETWHPSSRPPDFCLAETYSTRWLGLDVRSQAVAGNRTSIEFIARYRIGTGPAQQQNEISRFVREDGHWLYLDGEIPLPAPTYVNPRKR